MTSDLSKNYTVICRMAFQGRPVGLGRPTYEVILGQVLDTAMVTSATLNTPAENVDRDVDICSAAPAMSARLTE